MTKHINIDDLLLKTLQKMSEDIEAYGITDCKNYLPEYKQQLKDLMIETIYSIEPFIVTGGLDTNNAKSQRSYSMSDHINIDTATNKNGIEL